MVWFPSISGLWIKSAMTTGYGQDESLDSEQSEE